MEDRAAALREVSPYLRAAYDAFAQWGNVKAERLDVAPEDLARHYDSRHSARPPIHCTYPLHAPVAREARPEGGDA